MIPPPLILFASHDTRHAWYMQYGHLMESQGANSRRRIGGGMSSRRTKPGRVGLGYGVMLTLFHLGNGVGGNPFKLSMTRIHSDANRLH